MVDFFVGKPGLKTRTDAETWPGACWIEVARDFLVNDQG